MLGRDVYEDKKGRKKRVTCVHYLCVSWDLVVINISLLIAYYNMKSIFLLGESFGAGFDLLLRNLLIVF